MINGYLKVAAITPKVRVADVEFNCNEICKCIDDAASKKVKLMVFPELCITGYTCQDLFFQNRLLEVAKEALLKITEYSKGVAAEICEDLWVPNLPSTAHCMAGATVIANLSASNEIIGKSRYRRKQKI